MPGKRTAAPLQLPLTPMIDCTFQLILFFLLAAQMAGQELPKLALHVPEGPSPTALSVEAERPNHVTVNVLTSYNGSQADRDPNLAGIASRYQVGVDVVEAGRSDAMTQLAALLRSRRSQADSQGVSDFWVEIRADKDIRYADVEPVMQAAADAGIARMSLTAAVPERSPAIRSGGK